MEDSFPVFPGQDDLGFRRAPAFFQCVERLNQPGGPGQFKQRLAANLCVLQFQHPCRDGVDGEHAAFAVQGDQAFAHPPQYGAEFVSFPGQGVDRAPKSFPHAIKGAGKGRQFQRVGFGHAKIQIVAPEAFGCFPHILKRAADVPGE